MTEKEKLLGCAMSFFRCRHGSRRRFNKSKRNFDVSVHKRYCHLVRYYIHRIRALEEVSHDSPL
jgi:hypothetical protein